MSAISKIFCSCEYGKSKTNGLFEIILKSSGHRAESILHIGDNISTDYAAPRALKINALHFLQEDEHLTNLLRLQSISANIIDPLIRNTRPLSSPFRSILSSTQLSYDKPEVLIGYASLGPINVYLREIYCR